MDFRNAIDHTILNPTASRAQVTKICEETLEHQFASACIHPYWVRPMAERFPSLRICTVINFPLGMQTTGLYEAERAVVAGALELDIVVNPVLVAEKLWIDLEDELSHYRRIFSEITLKLIVESCQRTDEEIIRLTRLCSDTGFDFIKTSTGFAHGGASIHAVSLMAAHSSGTLRVKASGGIKTFDQASAMLAAGASRIGTSNGIALIQKTTSN